MAVVVLTVVAPRCEAPPEQTWWQKSVVYQIYVRSFYDTDGNGIGDINGERERENERDICEEEERERERDREKKGKREMGRERGGGEKDGRESERRNGEGGGGLRYACKRHRR